MMHCSTSLNRVTRLGLPPLRHRQNGLSLVVGMIMLVLISLLVTSGYVISTTNSKAVTNMQFRDEVIAAANDCIEQTFNTTFTDGFVSLPTGATSCSYDVNHDGTVDYTISVDPPVCKQAIAVTAGAAASAPSLTSNSLPSSTPDPYQASVWDVTAKVTDTASGASMEIHQGLRVNLTDAQKTAVCP